MVTIELSIGKLARNVNRMKEKLFGQPLNFFVLGTATFTAFYHLCAQVLGWYRQDQHLLHMTCHSMVYLVEMNQLYHL